MTDLGLLFQVFPISIDKGNGVRAPLKAVGNSMEVSGTIVKRAIRFIGSHLHFPAPSFFFHCKDNPSECRGKFTCPLSSAAVLCKINIGYFLFHHFSFKWQLVAL